MKKRPTTDGHNGAMVTTPHADAMVQLLGSGITDGGVILSRDEFEAVKKLYGYKREKPNKKPPPPEPPKREDFDGSWKFEQAQRTHEAALKAHAMWTDPMPLMQAGADRNAMRHAEADGLRLLAWIAKFVSPGEDPLKTLVQLAGDAGYDVDPADTEWAEAEEEESEDT